MTPRVSSARGRAGGRRSGGEEKSGERGFRRLASARLFTASSGRPRLVSRRAATSQKRQSRGSRSIASRTQPRASTALPRSSTSASCKYGEAAQGWRRRAASASARAQSAARDRGLAVAQLDVHQERMACAEITTQPATTTSRPSPKRGGTRTAARSPPRRPQPFCRERLGARDQAQPREAHGRHNGQLPHPVDARRDEEGHRERRQSCRREAVLAGEQQAPPHTCRQRDEERAGEQDETEQAELAERLQVQRVRVRTKPRSVPFSAHQAS